MATMLNTYGSSLPPKTLACPSLAISTISPLSPSTSRARLALMSLGDVTLFLPEPLLIAAGTVVFFLTTLVVTRPTQLTILSIRVTVTIVRSTVTPTS